MTTEQRDDRKQAIVTKLGDVPVDLAMNDHRNEDTVSLWADEEFCFSTQVKAEQFDGQYAMRAQVGLNIDGYGTFEIECDEGTSLGGKDAAPAPLSYLSVGVAFCLLSHVRDYAKANKMRVDGARVEQIVQFATTGSPAGMRAGTATGACRGLEVEVQVYSDEPEERIAELGRVVEQCCMALASFVNPVEAKVKVVPGG